MNDKLFMEAIRRRHEEISSEIARHRLGAALSGAARTGRWRQVIGGAVIGIGRLIEGEQLYPDDCAERM